MFGLKPAYRWRTLLYGVGRSEVVGPWRRVAWSWNAVSQGGESLGGTMGRDLRRLVGRGAEEGEQVCLDEGRLRRVSCCPGECAGRGEGGGVFCF